MSDISLVEGWTERVIVQMLADDSPLDLTGMTLAMIVHDKLGNPITFIGTVAILNSPGDDGKVYFDPDPADLKASQSPLTVRWKITDGAGKVAFFPRVDPGANADIWTISPQ